VLVPELLKQSAYWSRWIDSCKRKGLRLENIEGMVKMFVKQELGRTSAGYRTPVCSILRTAWGD
jgi:hypothetical protein